MTLNEMMAYLAGGMGFIFGVSRARHFGSIAAVATGIICGFVGFVVGYLCWTYIDDLGTTMNRASSQTRRRLLRICYVLLLLAWIGAFASLGVFANFRRR